MILGLRTRRLIRDDEVWCASWLSGRPIHVSCTREGPIWRVGRARGESAQVRRRPASDPPPHRRVDRPGRSRGIAVCSVLQGPDPSDLPDLSEEPIEGPDGAGVGWCPGSTGLPDTLGICLFRLIGWIGGSARLIGSPPSPGPRPVRSPGPGPPGGPRLPPPSTFHRGRRSGGPAPGPPPIP